VVGREQPVRVHEAVGFAGEAVPEPVTAFAAGLGHCLAGQWREALACFERHPEDPPSVAYVALCRKQLNAGAGISAWDGVWSLTEK
jgi:hypothetical protein